MNGSNSLTIESPLDAGHLSQLQIWIMVLCGAVALIDGFDTQAIAFVAPHIVNAWRLTPSAFGPVFGAGLLGSFAGALIMGSLGDRIGRKPALLLSVSIFAAGSLITAFVSSVGVLIGMRLVTGFGLGGALPCFIALASEYAPKRRRESLVSLMFCGFPVGAVIGGLVSEGMVALWGWQSVFIAGGLLPIAIAAIFIPVVPESIGHLASRGRFAEIHQILARMGLSASDDLMRASPPVRVTVSKLFAEKRAAGTLLLWTTLFLSLLLTYLLINWIPLVARAVGVNVRAAVIAVSLLNLGAVCGCLVIGWLADHYPPPRVIGCAYVAGAVAIFLIGRSQHSAVLLCATAFFSGILSIGAQMCTVSFCASFYDTTVRSTGVGWAMGIGRFGAIVGPVLGGLLLSAGVDAAALFATAATVSLGAGGVMWVMALTVPNDPEHRGRYERVSSKRRLAD